jgi:hypothetical protein
MTKANYVLYLVTGKIRTEIHRTENSGEAYRRYHVLILAGLFVEIEPVMVSA